MEGDSSVKEIMRDIINSWLGKLYANIGILFNKVFRLDIMIGLSEEFGHVQYLYFGRVLK